MESDTDDKSWNEIDYEEYASTVLNKMVPSVKNKENLLADAMTELLGSKDTTTPPDVKSAEFAFGSDWPPKGAVIAEPEEEEEEEGEAGAGWGNNNNDAELENEEAGVGWGADNNVAEPGKDGWKEDEKKGGGLDEW